MIKPYLKKSLYHIWEAYFLGQFVEQEGQKSGLLKTADKWLANYYLQHKSHGKRDRTFLTQAFFSALRHAQFALFCEDHAHHPDLSVDDWARAHHAKSQVLTRLVAMPVDRFFQWIFCRSNQNELVEDSAKTAFQRAQACLHNGASFAEKLIWHSIPFEFESALYAREALCGTTWVTDFLSLQCDKPPLWLRLNDPAQRDPIVQELASQGFSVLEELPLSKGLALAVSGQKSLYELPAYQLGALEIQDIASQQIGDSVQPKPSAMILDMCAGNGGKTLQLANLLQNTGAVYASDNVPRKLEELRRRSKKAKLMNIRTFPFDWLQEEPLQFSREVQKRGGFDWVLVDAPCSASGTWRRNPDAKWRFSVTELPDFLKRQRSLLRRAAEVTKTGGHMVYGTCSFFAEENEQMVQEFLDQHPNFSLVKQSLLGAPALNGDTMFVAVFLKNQEK